MLLKLAPSITPCRTLWEIAKSSVLRWCCYVATFDRYQRLGSAAVHPAELWGKFRLLRLREKCVCRQSRLFKMLNNSSAEISSMSMSAFPRYRVRMTFHFFGWIVKHVSAGAGFEKKNCRRECSRILCYF